MLLRLIRRIDSVVDNELNSSDWLGKDDGVHMGERMVGRG